MKQLIDVSIRRPVGVIMLVLASLVLGWISLKNLAIDLYPELDIPVAVIATSYDGAAPQEIEQLITRPIESVVGSIEGLKTIESVSAPGSSLVVLQFDWGKKIEDSILDIREKVDQVSGMLPENAGTPKVIKIDPQAQAILTLGLAGAPLEELQEIAENEVQPHLERIDGVASVGIEGGKKREIQVQLDRALLANYNLSATQVIQALGGENQAASAGNLRRGAQDLQLRIDGEFTTIDDINNTLITLMDGRTIKVSDVATVEDTHKDLTTKSKVNGQDSLVLSVMKQSDSNTVQMSDKVLKSMDELQEKLSARGIELSLILDTAEFIRASINTVVKNMLVGGSLAIIILFLFLRNIRTTLVIGLSIPISIIATFTLMYFTGETLNIISMGGLALGLGLMLDCSIVILESIYSKRQQGLGLIEAAREGATELAPAVLASTTTSVVVFLPIVFVSGIASQIFRPLSFTVSFALGASLLVSITLIPMLASKMLGKVKLKADSEEDMVERRLSLLKAFYKKVLVRALTFRKTTIAITFGLIVLSFSLSPFIGSEFIPESDTGQVQINLTAQTGAKLEETELIVAEINDYLEPYRDLISVSYAAVGSSGGFGVGSSNQAMFLIQLVPPSERSMNTTDFIKEVGKKLEDIPGVEATVSGIDMGFASGSPVQINISGSDMDVLDDLSQQVMWMLEDVDGLTNIDSTLSEGRPELTIVVNRAVASEYGLSNQQVIQEVSLAFSGRVATHYRTDGNEYDVRVMLPEDERQTIRDLETMFIRSSKGVEVPLTAVAELEYRQGPVEINRSNQERQVRVSADLQDRDLGSAIAEIEQQLKKMNAPDGYEITTAGQADEMAESFMQLTLAVALSIFLVYMVMAVQFESFLHPFVIMFSLPTSIIGVLIGLFVTGQSLSVTAFIGLIMLSGIVVSNAILLVDYINVLRSRGVALFDAIVESGLNRLRPILMTSLTTIISMIPLALGIGEGAEAQMPMAVVIIFGLSFSMLLTLILVPVVYLIVENLKTKFRFPRFPRFLRFRKRKAEEVIES